ALAGGRRLFFTRRGPGGRRPAVAGPILVRPPEEVVALGQSLVAVAVRLVDLGVVLGEAAEARATFLAPVHLVVALAVQAVPLAFAHESKLARVPAAGPRRAPSGAP